MLRSSSRSRIGRQERLAVDVVVEVGVTTGLRDGVLVVRHITNVADVLGDTKVRLEVAVGAWNELRLSVNCSTTFTSQTWPCYLHLLISTLSQQQQQAINVNKSVRRWASRLDVGEKPLHRCHSSLPPQTKGLAQQRRD